MKSVLTEARDWCGFALSLITGYAWWRERRGRSKDVIIQVPAATARAEMPTPTISVETADGRRFAWTGDEDVPAALRPNADLMARVIAHKFPSN